ncbi:unnamed protein product, partial [Didymodactylos carnosus]
GYSSGQILTGELKKTLIEILQKLVADHQVKRQQTSPPPSIVDPSSRIQVNDCSSSRKRKAPANDDVTMIRRPTSTIKRQKSTRFDPDQIFELETHYSQVDKYLSKQAAHKLSAKTGLLDDQVKRWFNNRRQRDTDL